MLFTADTGSGDADKWEPTRTASAPAAAASLTDSREEYPLSAIATQSAGINGRILGTVSRSISSVSRFRLFTPIIRAPESSARSSSCSSRTSKTISRSRSRPADASSRSLDGLTDRTITRAAATPSWAACSSWSGVTWKSLRRTGRLDARITWVMSSSLPPNRSGSVRTEIAAAPPASYCFACALLSIPELMTPLDGELRLISAITETKSRTSRELSLVIPERVAAIVPRLRAAPRRPDLASANSTSSPRVPPGGIQSESPCVSGVVRIIFEFGKCSVCRRDVRKDPSLRERYVAHQAPAGNTHLPD